MQGFRTIIEPFRIKMVEPLRLTTPEERAAKLAAAHYNLFLLRAEDVLIDLLTDSGTGAMSSAQWAKLIDGDESYAGSRSYFELEGVVRDLTGMRFIFPTHQGRAAERILFSTVGGPGKFFPNNTHFDTTRANIEATGATAIDCLPAAARDPWREMPFKGDMDVDALEALIARVGAANVPLCLVTVTNNSGGGQPVSLANLRQVRAVCDRHAIPLFLDACRFAENAYFIQQREFGLGGGISRPLRRREGTDPVPPVREGRREPRIIDVAREMFSLADGFLMSAKKDGHVNIGGLLAFNDESLVRRVRELEILTEGFPTYGGLAGRDLAAMAQGLREVVDEDYLQYRIASTAYLGNALIRAGIPIVRPVGGHAVYLDARAILPHLPPDQFPGQALACELYLAGGVRGVEIGSFMFKEHATMELVRLAIPRRVYTQSHVEYVVEVVAKAWENRANIRGFAIVDEPASLRHFSATLRRL